MKIVLSAAQLATALNDPEKFQETIVASEGSSIGQQLQAAFHQGLVKAAQSTAPKERAIKIR